MNITLDTNIKTSVFEIKDFEEDINIDILNKLINSDLLQTVSWTAGSIVFENEKQQLLLLKKLIKNNKLKCIKHFMKQQKSQHTKCFLA